MYKTYSNGAKVAARRVGIGALALAMPLAAMAQTTGGGSTDVDYAALGDAAKSGMVAIIAAVAGIAIAIKLLPAGLKFVMKLVGRASKL